MSAQSAADRRRRAQAVEKLLARHYPDAHCALHHRSPFELLVATVLSAQTTDERVNTVTPDLFARYPTPADLAGAERDAVCALVRPLGFQHRRADQLIGLARGLVADHGGEVPANRRDLEKLPGVGRKTAHVVLGNCFGEPALTVDTHVGRVARRLKLSEDTRPRRVEDDLAAVFTRQGAASDWTVLCHRLIAHGRAICHARSPQCSRCPLATVCPSAGSACA